MIRSGGVGEGDRKMSSELLLTYSSTYTFI